MISRQGRASHTAGMKISVHDFGGYPFTAQLARALGARGHEVQYLYAAGIKAPRARVVGSADDEGAVLYRGVLLEETYRLGAGIRRLRQEQRYGAVLAREIAGFGPDVVISANCPLISQRAAQSETAARGAAFVHWLQDVHSIAIGRLLRHALPVVGGLIGKRLASLERSILRDADGIVVIADQFLPTLERWGIPRDKIAIIENWAPLDEIEPRGQRNPWAQRHGLTDSMVFLYAGTLGRKHDPDLLIRLAAALPDARVVVVAEGSGMDRLRSASGIPANLLLQPLEPSEVVPDMLGTADVLVALLSDDAGVFSVPSKVLTYLAAGRPILAVVPTDNLAATVVAASGGGTVVAPEDGDGLVEAARRFASDPEGRRSAATAARAYAERTFDVRAKAAEFEAVLYQAVQRAHTHAAPRTDTALGTQHSQRESDG